MDNLHDIEHTIQDALKDIEKRALAAKGQGEPWPDGRWTKEIKSNLVDLAHNYGFEVSTSGCANANCGEWLFDLAWYKYNSARQMKNLMLAMECEWGNEDHIREDFEKLLVARAKYRLMIFQGNAIESIINDLKERIDVFEGSQAGDRYLFVGWYWGGQHFVFDNYVVQAQ